MCLLSFEKMKPLILLLFYLLLRARGQMLGGQPSRPGQWKFAVQIHNLDCAGQLRTDCTCNGAIIGDRWVVTAGHCVRTNRRNKNVMVIAGDIAAKRFDPDHPLYNQQNNKHLHRVEVRPKEIIQHPFFDNEPRNYDVALIFLESQITVNDHIEAASLPVPGQNPEIKAGDDCVVMGWGFSNMRGDTPVDISYFLKHALLRVSEVQDRHIMFYGMRRDQAHLIVGDSGSPLFCGDIDDRGKLFGVLKGGKLAQNYARYMRLEKFRGWIHLTRRIHEPEL